MRHASVAVVGAGPAGSSCAARLAASGIDTILLDRAIFPRPKPCAGWLTPRVFDLIGSTPNDYPGSLTRYERLHVRLRGIPVPVSGTQFAIRRLEFDAWLLKRGGVPLTVHDAREIRLDSGRFVVDGRYSADVLVGAGGTECPVRRAFFGGSAPRRSGNEIVAMEEEFAAVPADDLCRLWFFDRGLPGYAWYVPKGGTHLNIGIGGVRSSLRRRGEALRAYWNHFIERLETSGLVAPRKWRPAGCRYFLRQAGETGDRMGDATGQLPAGRLFLVGDALGLATVDMGEGIGAAIESGQRAAAAIITGEPYTASGIPRYSLLPAPLRALHRIATRRS